MSVADEDVEDEDVEDTSKKASQGVERPEVGQAVNLFSSEASQPFCLIYLDSSCAGYPENEYYCYQH